MSERKKPGIEEAYADMFEPPPRHIRRRGSGSGGEFVHIDGPIGLNTYVVKHRTEKAMPLLIAMHRRWAMGGKERLALTPTVWKEAGNPTKRARERILDHLRRMPDLVFLHEDRKPMYRYRVEKGLAWGRIEEAARRKNVVVAQDENDDDDDNEPKDN